MSILHRIAYGFGPYVNKDERQVARIFSGINERDSEYAVKDSLIRLTQMNVAAMNLWGEFRYKGYKYLTKTMRRKMYDNLEKIRLDFEDYASKHPVSADKVVAHVERLPTNTVVARSQPEKLAFIASIMGYLSPLRGLYVYRKSSSFGRLLQDPVKGVVEGDCNQIVTLYIYLYATKYDVKDLSLVVFPGHVALHFKGVDIEATNATFIHYERDDMSIAPIQEIASINLLDTSDSYFQTNKIPAETYLQAARLAYLTSSERKLVIKNLQSAYNNAVKELLEHNRYSVALKYAQQSQSKQLVETVGYNGAVYHMKSGQFSQARKFAGYTKDSVSLGRTISHNEGVHYYQAQKYHEAIKAFQRIGNNDMVKKCYEALYIKEQKLISGATTVDMLKAHSATIHRMKDYAQKSGNSKLISHVSKLLKYV